MNWPTPRWWYQRRGAPVTRALLTPLSWIWAFVTARRIAGTHPFDTRRPVICVGNLTVGGTGKTPVVRELVRRLQNNGRGAHILTRGYGGSLKGPVQVAVRSHTAAEVGDEPLMLAADAAVWVAQDRKAGAARAVTAGAQMLVMDDGHQNPSVKKTLSLVVVDGETRDGEWPLGGGGVVPAGPLREPLKAGLARAHAVIVLLPADLPQADPKLLALFGKTPVLIARLVPDAPPPAGPQLGFAGIGKPWKVERALKAAGCDLKDFAAFPDHGPYSEAILKTLAATAKSLGAGLVTTEKDWTRLPAPWRDRVTSWHVRVEFEDEAAIEALLARAV